ncbi:MAG: hypothetical protein A3A08_01450 [Candidatus Nealsonbacteria bacterium RIFCSPLOWO2_01_FULL_41_9]|uniref:Uncharacterized protein n=1 Tax=Candidatus Nealsonbacteria bacterium RIFCSPLOWO2_01_FULL_41_9 TaxID=1801671 RepID=A0A1G2EE05_9BACT|nr:MAG: hypothetical protein A3A08_01450 [Candidatus Nealsonbacteria bacterium RIFCSPLOWO2_01_FULL_41_9]
MKFRGFKKIESIKKLRRYHLPVPETIFIFNFKKQEKEIDDFLKGKKIISVRSDSASKSTFCPNIPRCPRGKAKLFAEKINKQGYAVILHEYLSVNKGRIAAGHILILKNYILMELIGSGAGSRLDRDGKIEEQIKFRKGNLKEVEHFGKRLTESRVLRNIAKLVKNIPPFKVLDFVLMKKGLYFYQIQEDKTARQLEGN